MIAIDWRNLRSLNGSQNNAFEELCCQLAEYEKPTGSKFYRKGTPDAGVECFAVLSDKTEWGWQAKYFLSVEDSQWSQLDDSVKTAIKKHPQLTKYTICLPIDRPDARIEGKESLLDKWNNRAKKWEIWASEAGIQIQFEYWGSYEIFERLSREEHRGRFFFWFGSEFFSQSWFKDRLQESIEVAGPRYTPRIHVELPVAQTFDGLARTPSFYTRFKHILRDVKKERLWIYLQNLGEEMTALVSTLESRTQRLVDTALSMDQFFTEPIPWASVDQLSSEVLQGAYDCLDQLENLEKQLGEQTKAQEEKSPMYGGGDGRKYREASSYIYRFMQKVRELQSFSQNIFTKLSNVSALLLCGDAGQGKTHLFCDIADKRITEGFPTILLMGQRFTQADPWIQIVRQLGLPETTTRDEFLGALQAIAQAKHAKALIMIDALNEGEGKRIWYSNLPAMLQTISRYPWISVAVSVRSSYEHVVIADDLVDEKLVKVEHHGFAEHEYQATRTFFDYYGIEHPSVPLLVPEFQNPLFLKLLCKGLHEDNQSRFPVGLSGITAVFKLFVEATNEKLWREVYHEFHSKPRPIVWRAIDYIAQVMADKKQDWILVEEAEGLVNQVSPSYRGEQSLFRSLVDEGILVENCRWQSQHEWAEVVQFAYERFSEHLIVKYLLDKHFNNNVPEWAFLPNRPLAFLTESEWQYQGLVEALCIQVPERVNKELPEIAPMMADFYSVGRGFVQSLIWRDPRAITDVTRRYLYKYAGQLQDLNDQILDALLSVTTNPEHPYNADFLHARLMKDEMAERDAWWSTFLHYQYDAHNAVDRLVDWAWSSEDKSHIEDEAIRLCGVALSWFLTTSNRFLRDRATKALVSLFTHRIPVLMAVLEQFADVNDIYVLERLYAVAYGCALRSVDDFQIGSLARVIYDRVFRDGEPPVHILLRDYARGVVEYALYRGIELDIEIDNIQPPYHSEWPYIPTEEEIEGYKRPLASYDSGDELWSHNRIIRSIMNDDFAYYIIGTNHGSSDWLSLRLEEPTWRSPKEDYKDFVDSLTSKQRRKWEELLSTRQRREVHFEKIFAELTNEELEALILLEYKVNQGISEEDQQEVELPEVNEDELESIENEIASAEQSFRNTLGRGKLNTFDKKVLPYLDVTNRPSNQPPQFDLSLVQLWILKRAFELGWTVEYFGRFDRSIGDYGRSAHKAERIGKKYQWLAYHEFLARLADNFQFREQFSDDPKMHQYLGPWQIHRRDIDPSCILRKTGRGDGWTKYSPIWWFSSIYNSWDEPADDAEWMNMSNDLPKFETLVDVINPQDYSEWLVLDGFFSWEQPTPPEEYKYDLDRREIWYLVQSYFVKDTDIDELYEWAAKQDYMGRWMPETREIYNAVFLGEFFWSRAYEYHCIPYMRTVGWQGDTLNGRIPKPIMPTTDGYFREDSGYDCSIDEGIGISLPSQFIVKMMDLRWNGVEGNYYDRSGKLVAFDPSTQEDGPSLVLINRDVFLAFLEENGLSILWTLLGEKQMISGGFRHDEWKGHLEISGAYRFTKNGQFEGSVTPCFRSPQD